MKNASSLFFSLWKKQYCHMGFTRYKNTFARIENDVIQSFTLKTSCGGRNVTIEFGIIPLCAPIPELPSGMLFPIIEMNRYDLSNFYADDPEIRGGWKIDSPSEESIIRCVRSMLRAVDSFLVPLFQNCMDCHSTLFELIKMESFFDENRRAFLRLIGESDCATGWEDISLFDSNKYYMAMKSNNYEYMRKYLIYQLDFCTKKIQQFRNEKPPTPQEKGAQKYVQKLNATQQHLECLNSGNWAYFQALIEHNEQEVLALISQKYSKLLRT